MTSLIVEDGSIVANSNTFISVANFVLYAADRGITIDNTSAAVTIFKLNDYIGSLPFNGDLVEDDQTMPFPRENLYVNGALIANDIVPKQIIKGSYELGLSINAGYDPTAVVERATKSEQLGPMKVEYMDNASTQDINVNYDVWFQPFLDENSSSNFIHFTTERTY